MNTMSFDIFSIIINYIKPKKLLRFFRKHNLHTGLRFRYDAKNYILYPSDVRTIFDKFPNIHILSLQLRHKTDGLHLFGFITSLRFLQYAHINMDMTTRNPTILSNLSKKCPNIKCLKLTSYKSNSSNEYITSCTKLKHIILYLCSHFHTLQLSKCPSIRTIRIEATHLEENDLRDLSKCTQYFLHLNGCTGVSSDLGDYSS